MQVQLNTDRNIDGTQGLAAHVTGIVEASLSHVRDRITRVEVHLSDENSDKKRGDSDIRCVMEARIEGRPPVAATHDAATVDQAATGAAGKLSRILERALSDSRG
jgi:hypothetical protein